MELKDTRVTITHREHGTKTGIHSMELKEDRRLRELLEAGEIENPFNGIERIGVRGLWGVMV